MKLKCVDLRITNVNYFHICNLLAKQGLKICTTQISLSIILHLILYRSDFPFFCTMSDLDTFFRLKVENIIYHDTCMTQVFLTAGFILLSKNFFVFLKSREKFFENPGYYYLERFWSIHIWRQMLFGHFWPTYLP